MATATIRLIDKTGAPQANLTSVRWAWFDEDIGAMNAPTDVGASETTDGSGDLALSMPSSVLTSGQTGTLVLHLTAGDLAGAYRVAVD